MAKATDTDSTTQPGDRAQMWIHEAHVEYLDSVGISLARTKPARVIAIAKSTGRAFRQSKIYLAAKKAHDAEVKEAAKERAATRKATAATKKASTKATGTAKRTTAKASTAKKATGAKKASTRASSKAKASDNPFD